MRDFFIFMVSGERLRYLIEEGYDESEVALIHGTSLSSAISVLNVGRMPGSPSKHYEGYIHFFQVSENFDNSFLNAVKFSEQGISEAESYAFMEAKTNERSWHFNDMLGRGDIYERLDLNGDEDLEYLIQGGFDIQSLRDSLKRYGFSRERSVDFSYYEANRKMKSAKGVVFGFSKGVFELNIKFEADPGYGALNGDDGIIESVRCYLPEGLSLDYLQYVLPGGEREERGLLDAFKIKLSV